MLQPLLPIACLLLVTACGRAQDPSMAGSKLPEKPRSLESALRAIRPAVLEKIGAEMLEQATDGEPLTIIALKEEQRVEVWKERAGKQTKILEMPFSASSGKLGPKLREGDRQIPEGIYPVTTLNPNSKFHLSFEIGYPTPEEKKRAKAEGRERPGGEIFFHGKAVTVGCVPVGDANIEVLFTLVAGNGMKKCEVIIAPRDFRKGLPAPEIAGPDWIGELYGELRVEMARFVEKE